MRTIIDGKQYNTDTATTLAADAYGNTGDFNHWRESLYQTKNGAFFLAGSGGPLSKYARSPRLNEWTSGEGISVLTEADALRWCEKHDVDVDVIAQHFTIEEA